MKFTWIPVLIGFLCPMAIAQDAMLSMDPANPSVGGSLNFTLNAGPDNAGSISALYYRQGNGNYFLLGIGHANALGQFLVSYQPIPESLAGQSFSVIGYVLDPADGILASNVQEFTIGNGNLLPIIEPSRTSGVAPLGVFFDGTQTEGLADGDYVDAYFDWDFDRTGVDSDHPFRSGQGFVIGHVFDLPGTYEVQLTVTDQEGKVGASEPVTITVLDPASTYQDTYCISTSGNFAGCPANDPAHHIQTSSFSQALNQLDPGVRVLFRRGETWTVNSTLEVNDLQGPSQIGAFPDPEDEENASKPTLRSTQNNGSSYILKLDSNHDFRITNFRLVGNYSPGGGSGTKGIYADKGSHLLLDNLEITGVINGLNIRESDSPNHATDGVFLTDNFIHDTDGYGFFGPGLRFAAINNLIQNADTHGMRFPGGHRSFINSNTILNTKQDRAAIAIRGQGNVGFNHDIVVSDNLVDNTIHFQPSNDQVDQDIHHFLCERNRILKPAGEIYDTGIRIRGHHGVIRNNIIHDMEKAISLKDHPLVDDSHALRIYNNTAIFPQATTFHCKFFNFQPGSRDIGLFNNISLYLGSQSGHSYIYADQNDIYQELEANFNICWAPFAENWKPFKIANENLSLAQWQSRSGMDAQTLRVDPEFLSTDPEQVDFARPAQGSPVIDAARWMPFLRDVFGDPVPVDGDGDGLAETDRGAVEAP